MKLCARHGTPLSATGSCAECRRGYKVARRAMKRAEKAKISAGLAKIRASETWKRLVAAAQRHETEQLLAQVRAELASTGYAPTGAAFEGFPGYIPEGRKV